MLKVGPEKMARRFENVEIETYGTAEVAHWLRIPARTMRSWISNDGIVVPADSSITILLGEAMGQRLMGANTGNEGADRQTAAAAYGFHHQGGNVILLWPRL